MASGAFLIEGERAVRQIADSHPEAILEILAAPGMSSKFQGFAARELTLKQVSSLSSTKTPQGVMAVVRLPEDVYTAGLPHDPGDRVLVLEHVQDPGNAGTLIRTAAAFGFSGIIMSEKTADPFSPKVVQSTAGSVLSLWIRRTAGYLELISSLSSAGYKVAAAELNGASGPDILSKIPRLALVLGNEASGLSKDVLKMADYRVKIPMDRNRAESLNVAVSGGILMYQAAK